MLCPRLPVHVIHLVADSRGHDAAVLAAGGGVAAPLRLQGCNSIDIWNLRLEIGCKLRPYMAMVKTQSKGPFTNDVSREGEGGWIPKF